MIMVGHFPGETLGNWADDFVQSNDVALFSDAERDVTRPVLERLMIAAYDVRAAVLPSIF